MAKYFTILIITAIFGCCHKKAASTLNTNNNSGSSSSNLQSSPSQKMKNAVKNIILDPQLEIMNTGAAYTIDSIKINADTISIFVNYSGGCKEHSFELLSNGMYTKSLPPQISLCLRHTGNEDACRMLVTEELKFNIAQIKHPVSKTIIVKLGGNQRINYTSE